MKKKQPLRIFILQNAIHKTLIYYASYEFVLGIICLRIMSVVGTCHCKRDVSYGKSFFSCIFIAIVGIQTFQRDLIIQ